MNTEIHGKKMTEGKITRQVSIGKQRSNVEIIAEMLRSGEKGADKTEMMTSEDMSQGQVQKYLDYLVNQDFINKMDLDDTMEVYKVTENGLKFLKAIDNLMEML